MIGERQGGFWLKCLFSLQKKYTKNKRAQRDIEEQQELDRLRKSVDSAERELKQLGAAGRNHVRGQKLASQLEEDRTALAKLERTISRRLQADGLCEVTENQTKFLPKAMASSGPRDTGNVDVSLYTAFVEKHEKILEEYLDLYARDLSVSCDFVLKYPEVLLSADAETYAMFACLELEMNGNSEKMERVARQGHLISQTLELSRAIHGDAREGVLDRKATEHMLDKLQGSEELRAEFLKSVALFVERIKARAVEKKTEEAAVLASGAGAAEDGSGEQGRSGDELAQTGGQRATGEGTVPADEGSAGGEDAKQIGPGGLDAQEVFETLPETLQQAFLEKDMQKLLAAFQALPEKDAKYHMQRCVAGGLWVVPEGGVDDAGRDSDSD